MVDTLFDLLEFCIQVCPISVRAENCGQMGIVNLQHFQLEILAEKLLGNISNGIEV